VTAAVGWTSATSGRQPAYNSSLNSLLAGMMARTPGAVHAVLATVDGVVVAMSAGLPQVRAEQLATIGAGLLSIADGAGMMMSTGAPRVVFVEMLGGLLLAAPVGKRIGLSVLAKPNSDRELLGFEVAQFAGHVSPLVAHIR
jgi:predicted regulator of Ras-like GTPase activity (Roadblock/LC7/MglB family)